MARDSGLACLVTVARVHGLAADAARLAHEFGTPGREFDDIALLRAARALGLRARRTRSRWPRLAATPMPAIARFEDGTFVVVAGVRDDAVLVHRPQHARPEMMPRAVFAAAWSGALILLARRADGGAGPRRFGLAWFVPFVMRYRACLGEVLLASCFLQLCALVSPLFFQVVIDKVLVHRGLTTLDILAVGLFVVALFEAVLGGLRTYLFTHTTSRVDVALASELFRHLTRLPLAWFEARRVGDTVARVRELETLREFLTGNAITLVVDATFTIVFFAVMALYSTTLTCVVAATLPCYGLLAAGLTAPLRGRLRETFERAADNHAYLVETVAAMATIKSAAVEPAARRHWEERLAAHVTAGFRAALLGDFATQVAAFVNKLMTLAILWLGAHAVMDGALSVGQLVAFNMLAARIAAPVLRLVQTWHGFQQAAISLQRLGDILQAAPEPDAGPGRAALPRLQGRVTFEAVDFRYRPALSLALQDVSFAIAPGEIVGIVGHSGSGKSTLTRLLQRLYVPERGRILLDGVDLALLDVAWLRRQVGVVLQDDVLFNRAVRENIALADPAMPLTRVVEAARLAGAHEFILELEHGYDTVIGERGESLSGGQRQRLAIARALAADPRILVLDEATSALDYESEARVQANMRRICAGRTVIIVAHRLSALRHADRIVVLEQGRLVEQGRPADLAARNGFFAGMVRQQSVGNVRAGAA